VQRLRELGHNWVMTNWLLPYEWETLDCLLRTPTACVVLDCFGETVKHQQHNGIILSESLCLPQMISLSHHIRTITCRRDHGFWARNFDCERLFGNFCEGYVLCILCGFLSLKTIHSNIQLIRSYTTVVWNHLSRNTSTFVWIAWKDSCHGCIPRTPSVFLGEGLSRRSN
jgi:hypothetical protein